MCTCPNRRTEQMPGSDDTFIIPLFPANNPRISRVIGWAQIAISQSHEAMRSEPPRPRPNGHWRNSPIRCERTITQHTLTKHPWATEIRANGVSWPHWNNGWKIRKRKQNKSKKSSFLNGGGRMGVKWYEWWLAGQADYYYYFLARQHKAAGRKTKLDIQNYGCNGNYYYYWQCWPHIYTDICQNAPYFVVKFSKFSSPQAARGHWPHNQNPAPPPPQTPHRTYVSSANARSIVIRRQYGRLTGGAACVVGAQ